MALIICSECGKEYSDRASSCPNCGCPTHINTGERVPKGQVSSMPVPRVMEAQKAPEVSSKTSNRKYTILAIIAFGLAAFGLLIGCTTRGRISGKWVSEYSKTGEDGGNEKRTVKFGFFGSYNDEIILTITSGRMETTSTGDWEFGTASKLIVNSSSEIRLYELNSNTPFAEETFKATEDTYEYSKDAIHTDAENRPWYVKGNTLYYQRKAYKMSLFVWIVRRFGITILMMGVGIVMIIKAKSGKKVNTSLTENLLANSQLVAQTSSAPDIRDNTFGGIESENIWICEKCGTRNKSSSRTCCGCGENR